MMIKQLNTQLFIFLTAALIFTMVQQTPAQKKQKNAKKTAVETKQTAPVISYTVSMSKPATHLLEVEMRLDWATMPAALELKMPVWTPGSYLIREYARHVESFSAKDESGAELTWRKTNKNTWQIDAKGKQQIVARYNVYANELTVRTNELNSDHAFFNNAALLMFPKDQLKTASTVKVVPFGDWKIATGLPKAEGATNTFRAENFDILYDSPFDVGNFDEVSFDVQGKPHRFVIDGGGNYDINKIAADTAKIVEQAYKIFGELPYENYLFILNTRGGGGLEHLNSTALQFNRAAFNSRYDDFLTLVAHEYFHLWNVKRIKPDALGPFDYENENYTKLLWVAEGGTAYYEGVLVERAGLLSAEKFLSGKAAQMQALQNRPGRFETSLEDASFDAWIKYYRPDENAVNNQISYYDKGELVNFLLDLEIRRATNGAKSLDDVIRFLYTEYARKNRNYTPEDFQKVCEQIAGTSLNDFFEKYVRGTAEIDYDSILNAFGLRLTTAAANSSEKAFLGGDFVQQGERLTVRNVQKETPAYEQGLNAGDQIVALDGSRVSQTDSVTKTSVSPTDSVKDLNAQIEARKPGDKIRLTVFRFDQLREIEITLGGRVKPDYKIASVDVPNDAQKRLYQQYFNAELKAK